MRIGKISIIILVNNKRYYFNEQKCVLTNIIIATFQTVCLITLILNLVND